MTRRTRSVHPAQTRSTGTCCAVDLLPQDDDLERRDQRGREVGEVARDAELAEQVAHVHRRRTTAPRSGGRRDCRPPRSARRAAGEQSIRDSPNASSRSIGGAPGPSGGGPPITAACHSVSEWLSSAPIRPSRRVEPPEDGALADPGAAATASMVTASTPTSSTSAGRGRHQRLAVARGVAALGGGVVSEGQQRVRHGAVTLGGAPTTSRTFPIAPGIEPDHGPFRSA